MAAQFFLEISAFEAIRQDDPLAGAGPRERDFFGLHKARFVGKQNSVGALNGRAQSFALSAPLRHMHDGKIGAMLGPPTDQGY